MNIEKLSSEDETSNGILGAVSNLAMLLKIILEVLGLAVIGILAAMFF